MYKSYNTEYSLNVDYNIYIIVETVKVFASDPSTLAEPAAKIVGKVGSTNGTIVERSFPKTTSFGRNSVRV